MALDRYHLVRAPTKTNLGGAFQISSTVSDEQDTGVYPPGSTSGPSTKVINFMTSVDDTYLLFDSDSTMTDIVVADYAGDERCMGPFAAGTVYSFEVATRSRYFTVITASNSGVFRWWTDQ